MAKHPVKNGSQRDADAPEPDRADRTRMEASPFATEEPSAGKKKGGRPTPTSQAMRAEKPSRQDSTRMVDVSGHTPIEDSDATSAGPPVTLEIIGGPDTGTKRRLRGGRMIIGRGDGCDLQLADGSVSRRHLELVVGPSGVVLRDLGSGNGTRVNGQRVPEAVLVHKDKVSVGQTVFVIIDEMKLFDEDMAERDAKAEPRKTAVKADEDEVDAPPEEDDAQDEPPKERAPRASGPSPRHSDPQAGVTTGKLVAAQRTKKAAHEPAEPQSTANVGVPPRHRQRPEDPLGAIVDALQGLPRTTRIGLYAGVACFLVLMLFLFVSIIARPKAPPDPPPSRVDHAAYASLVKEGKALFREKQYEQALKKLLEAREIDNRGDLTGTLEVAKAAVAGAQFLADAKVAAGRKRYDEALVALKKVTERADQYDEAKELISRYETERIEARGSDLRAALAEGDLDTARSMLAGLPNEKRREAEREIAETEQRIRGERAQGIYRAQRAKETRERHKVAQEDAEVSSAISAVVRKIDSGNFEAALRELERVSESTTSDVVVKKAKALRRLIPEFGRTYSEGEAKYEAGAYETAATLLSRALQIYRDMSINGGLTASLREKILKANLFKSRSALGRQEYGLAARTFKEILAEYPGNAEAKEGLSQMARKAKDVYLQGYTQREIDPEWARQKFREVLDMVPSDDPSHKMAKKRLEILETR